MQTRQVGTKTEQGKYSSKYALTELLICGECGTPYRRCTWTVKGKKKIVWRCINRLDYGKKYCHDSPSLEESVLQNAIMDAIHKAAMQNTKLLKIFKLHIGMGISGFENEDRSLELQVKIAELDNEFRKMLQSVSTVNENNPDNEERMTQVLLEKRKLETELEQQNQAKQKRENAKSRINDIYTILEGLANHPMTFDNQLIRQLLECVVVESKEQIKAVFVGGAEIEQSLL